MVIGVAAAVVLFVGGPFVYIHFIEKKAPAPFSITDTVPTSAPATPTTKLTTLDGTWKIASGSSAGYRIKETLFGQSGTAAGRTTAITGTFTLAGSTVSAASFSVDMTQVSSDKSIRDSQFQGRIMDTASFPTSTFVLTSPIELGHVPGNNVVITPKATGKLTLHGTTRTVTIPLAAELTGNAIKVTGSLPVTFADYNINNPSGGPASVGNSGTLEFLFLLTKS